MRPVLGTTEASPVDWRRCGSLGLIGLVISLALVAVSLLSTPAPSPTETDGGYVSLYRPPDDRFEALLNRADGQAYASLAQDPSLARGEVFDEGKKSAAYWASRPVLPYSLYAMSFGRPDLIPAAFLVLEGLAGGLLVLASAATLHRTGRQHLDRLSLAVLALPGTLIGIVWLGQDVLAVAFALLGLVGWFGRRRPNLVGSGWLTLAVLTRETMLVVVLVLVVFELRQHGVQRRLVALAVPLVAYLLWGWVVNLRFGVSAGPLVGGNLDLPFVGVLSTASQWSVVGAVMVLAQFVLAIAAIWHWCCQVLRWQTIGFLVALAFTGERVWVGWEAGVRVGLPLTVFALLTLHLPVRWTRSWSRERPTPASALAAGSTTRLRPGPG